VSWSHVGGILILKVLIKKLDMVLKQDVTSPMPDAIIEAPKPIVFFF